MAMVPASIRGGIDDFMGFGPGIIKTPDDNPYFEFKATEESDSEEEIATDPLMDYNKELMGRAFKGAVPYDTIVENIKNQFSSYRSTEDRTNYVSLFYQQLTLSWNNYSSQVIDNDIEQKLYALEAEFVQLMLGLFESKLTVSILDPDNYDVDEMEDVLTKMYDCFILNSRKNFQRVIAADIAKNVQYTSDNRAMLKAIRDKLPGYTPIITSVTPTEFLQYLNATDIISLYEENKVRGNFLRRYATALYDDEELQADIVSQAMILMEAKSQLQGDVNNG